MRAGPSNPETNKLHEGTKEEGLIEAIRISGYPLQGIVAQKLLRKFDVTEEWGYLDPETETHRSLDVYAFKAFPDEKEPSIQPGIVLLIECKRSHHPYIFFEDVTEKPVWRFPRLGGVKKMIDVRAKGTNRSTLLSGDQILGLQSLPFVKPGPPRCAVFSKGIPQGKEVRLSGAEPYNELLLPLARASDHALKRLKPADSPKILFASLVLSLSVLDAPMVLVENPEKPEDPLLTPWVRVIRHEVTKDPMSWDPFRHYAVDVVHVDYLDTFIENSLLPFASEFAGRAREKVGVFFTGGEVADLEAYDWKDIRATRA